MADIAVSYCETVWAGSESPFHVRLLAEGEEKVYDGGLSIAALCGAEVAWDIDMEITAQRAVQASYTCESCKRVLAVVLRDLEVSLAR